MQSHMDIRRAQVAEKEAWSQNPGVSESCAHERALHQQGHPAPTATAPDTAPAGHAAPLDTTRALECPSGHGPDFETEVGILIPKMRRLTRATP